MTASELASVSPLTPPLTEEDVKIFECKDEEEKLDAEEEMARMSNVSDFGRACSSMAQREAEMTNEYDGLTQYIPDDQVLDRRWKLPRLIVESCSK